MKLWKDCQRTWQSFEFGKDAAILALRATKYILILGMWETISKMSYLDFMSNVLLKDQIAFRISFVNQGPEVWRKERTERQNPKCLKSCVLLLSMMIWVTKSCQWYFIISKVNAAIYQERELHEDLISSWRFLFLTEWKPNHNAITTAKWFTNHDQNADNHYCIWPTGLIWIPKRIY